MLAAADVEAGADDAGALAGAEELAGAGEVLTAAEPPQLASSTADSAIDAIVFFIWISS
ncbi:MAG: hypothetical protein JOZ39_02825 [Chloroflexi bacterium]|nr:hypothetical protein [Chloroflexota bacterium]